MNSAVQTDFGPSMTNVHDVFYPSETRLHSLVGSGEYFVRERSLPLAEMAKIR